MSEIVDAGFRTQRAMLPVILPYVPEPYREFVSMGGDISGAAGYAMPDTVFNLPRDGAPPDDAEHARARLDALGVDVAVLDPGNAWSIGAIGNLDIAAALATGTNDWQAVEWLDGDSRLRGSIVVGARDPLLAAKEIRRCATDERFVQVQLAYPPELLGDRSLHPIFEAAEETGRPVTIQAGGAYAGANRGLTGAGFPQTPFEYELGALYTGQPQLLSVLCNGTFDRFPGAKVVLSGFGAAWLPSLLWRLDREVELDRLETPRRLTRRPSEIVAEHVRVTTAPLELPDDPEKLDALFSLVDADRLLLYASGALGDPPSVLDGLRKKARNRILGGNAAALYGLGVAA